MSHVDLLIGGAVAVVVAYPIGMRLLANAVQPSRLRMANLGNEILESQFSTPTQRYLVNSMLDDAYDPRIMILLALALPVYVIGRVFGLIQNTEEDGPSTGVMGGKMRELSNLHTIAISAANPLACLFVVFETIIIGAITAPLAVLQVTFRGSVKIGDSLDLNAFASTLSERISGHSHAH